MNSIAKSIIARLTLLAVAALFIHTVVSAYLVLRAERIRTRISVRLDGPEQEFMVALPMGAYQIQYTSAPDVGIVASSSSLPVLPATITTSVTRAGNGKSILSPNTNEHVGFTIAAEDAFQPSTLRVSIVRKEPCLIYMRLAPSF